MESTDREWIKSVLEGSGKLASYIDKNWIRTLLLIYTLENEGKKEIKEEIDSLINTFSKDFILSEKPILECPSKIESKGEIIVGKVCQGERTLWNFGLTKEEINQHTLIVGRSGSGKTTLIISIISQLIKNNIPFLVFDFKRDYRHLIKIYSDLWVFRYSDLRLNLLQPPPGVSLNRWEQIFCDLYAFNYGWFHGSRNMLQEYLHALYEEKGERATLPELYERMIEAEERTRKRQEYFDVVTNRLFSTITNLGDVVRCEKSIPIEVLLEHPVVIELDGLARDEQNLIVEYFLFWIYAYRMSRGHRGRLRHVLIFDEAKRVFDAGKELRESASEMGVAPIDIITDEIRDFGEGLIVSDQEPTKLTHSIKANTYTKITGFLGHGRDVEDIAEAMNLNEEEMDAIARLERGEWIVKLAGRYTKPFMIRSEDFPLKKDVTDKKLAMRMKPILNKLRTLSTIPIKSTRKEKIFQLSDDARRLLIHVFEHPFNGIVSRAKALGFSGRRIESAKRELIERELVREVGVVLTSKRPTKFLVPTKKAVKLLESNGIDTSLWRHVGNVGFKHMLFQVLIRWEYLRLGYEAHIEAKVDNKRIDVLAVRDNERIGIEIELNPNNCREEMLDKLNGLTRIYIVSDTKERLKVIKNRLADNGKVIFVTIRDFLISLHNMVRNHSGNSSFSQKKAEFNLSRNLLRGERIEKRGK